MDALKVALLSREYPPEVYGGAGVHVEHLAAALARMVELEVHCFGAERPQTPSVKIVSNEPWERLKGEAAQLGALRAMSVDLAMAAELDGVDLVHSHTWYTNFAGHLAKLLYGVPHVVTVHSLEPKRPWKAHQLARGYVLSSWCERIGLDSADAIIAVSHATATDICDCYPGIDPSRVTVIHNGIDTEEFRPDPNTDVLERYGIDPGRPIVVCVGRVTPQKGIGYLLDAADDFDPSAQVVLRVGAADTPAMATEIENRIAALAARRPGVVWIQDALDVQSLVQLLTHATVACCPSVYEPFGLVNLEAMACETPVVASAVGGIPEIVEHRHAGLLVPFEPTSAIDPAPRNAAKFAHDLAAAINELVANQDLAHEMGRAGRRRVVEVFSWDAVAANTVSLYNRLVR